MYVMYVSMYVCGRKYIEFFSVDFKFFQHLKKKSNEKIYLGTSVITDKKFIRLYWCLFSIHYSVPCQNEHEIELNFLITIVSNLRVMTHIKHAFRNRIIKYHATNNNERHVDSHAVYYLRNLHLPPHQLGHSKRRIIAFPTKVEKLVHTHR